ncbi:unnamed protein product, partial [Prorocentrum cordatum]
MYAAWAAALRQADMLPLLSAKALVELADVEAKRLQAQSAHDKDREWSKWVDKHSSGGMSALFKFSSLPIGWQPGALHLDRAEPRAATATDAAATWEKQAAQSTLTVEYLIVGGGGGGASGGGGGGGVLQGTGLVMSVDEVITVGTGGLGGSGGSGTTAEATNGGDSSIGSLVAYGGGKGAGGSSRTASSGGSGGGGAYDLPSVAYAAGVAGQGYRGGRSDRGGYGAGGGGGGAGGVGSDAPQQHYGGDGGVGVASSISGTSTYYGGGGGGGVNANCGCTTYPGGAGGLGGGGDGSSYGGGGGAYFNGEDGQANTGGGGGGTDPESSLAGNGGSGIVIIKYLSSIPLLQGGTVTTSNGYQIHTFTATGSHTVAVEAACGAWRYYRYYVPVASANPHHLCINEMQYLYGGSVLSTPATHCGSAPCAFATSGFYSDWSPEKAFDQSNYAMYGSGYCNEAGDGYPRGAGWLAYDFGVPTQVDQVKIWFWRGDHSASGTAYMEGSNDAVTWTTLKTITDTDYATLDTTVDCVASPSSAPTLLMKLRAGSNTFQYDASYWTDTSVLNEAGGASVSDSDDEDVKMSAFNTDPISALTLCYKTLDNCYTYELGATYTSASALFSSGFIRSENLGYGAGAADAAKQAWTDLFLPPGTPTWYDDYWNGNGGGNCNMQRPGINTQCNDNNWARIGYCVNLPDQSCQPYDTSDADSPIGIGLKTQNWPNNVNAPFGEYFIHGAGSSGVQLFQHQAWLFAGRQRSAARCEYIKFEKTTRTDIAKEVFVSGTALAPNWGNSPDKKTPLKLFHYMMDRTLERWAVTLKRIGPFLFDRIVAPILRGPDVHGTMWIGKTRVGKSTASKTIGFAISAYQIEKHCRADLRPIVIAAKKIGFLRLEPGTIIKPAIADDTALAKWGPDEIKAFLDPAEEDALLWAKRWGGASFEQNQSRQICVNPYNEEFEATAESVSREQEEVAFSDFIQIIGCSFICEKQCSYKMADVEAYMARSNVVLLSPNRVYFRAASTTKEPAPRFPRPVPAKPDLFTPETCDILTAFKKDQTRVPSDYDQHMRWAVAAMKKLARGEELGQSSTVRGPTLFDQDAPTRCNFPEVATQPPSDSDISSPQPLKRGAERLACPDVSTMDEEERERAMQAMKESIIERGREAHGSSIDLLSPARPPAADVASQDIAAAMAEGAAAASGDERAEPRAATATDAAATWEKQAAQSTLTANTGGGGGGTDPESSLAGNGGSGIVIIKYLSSIPLLQGGTVTTSNGYQIHTFTATGSHTVAVEAACGAWRYYRYYVPVASANPHHLCINEMQYLYGGSVLSTPATHCGSAPCAFATSGFYSDWSPEKAFDQSNYAMYGSGYCNEAGDGYPRGAGWLAYDFGVPTQVDQVKIWFWRGDHSASGTAYMEGSNDAVTWTTLKTITDTGYATLDTTVDCVASPSSAPTLLMKLRAGSNTFQYDASYWTDTSVLNEAGGASVSDSDDEDVKMSAFNTDPISALTLCYKTLDNCYTYELGATYTSASALFSSGFIRSEYLGYGAGAADAAKQAWTDLFLPPGTPTWYDDYWNGNGGGNCNMQRPGINTQCNDNNWARIGYCVNLPDQSCQPYDSSDADSPIGIGLKTQNWPNNVNAPFGEYFIHGAGSSGVQLFQHQAWLFAGK